MLAYLIGKHGRRSEVGPSSTLPVVTSKHAACHGLVSLSPDRTPFTNGAPLCLGSATHIETDQTQQKYVMLLSQPRVRIEATQQRATTYGHFAPTQCRLPAAVRNTRTFLRPSGAATRRMVPGANSADLHTTTDNVRPLDVLRLCCHRCQTFH